MRNSKYRSVLITGGAGFIGRQTVKKLLKEGYFVTAFDLVEQFDRHNAFFQSLEGRERLRICVGSILDRTALRSAFKGVDAVLHFAAMLGVKRTEENRLACMEINVSGTENALEASIVSGVRKFVFASSSEVYGEPNQNPIVERDPTQGKTVYGVSKIAGEELVKGYHQMYPQLDYTIVRFFNTYGEGQVAQFVISKFIKAVLNGENPIVYGDGEQIRSYGHVDDLSDGITAILSNPVSNGKVYNLGNSTQKYTLIQLAKLVVDTLAPKSGLQVKVLGTFKGTDRDESREVKCRYCDTSLAQNELNYRPKVSVKEGILRIKNTGFIHGDWPSWWKEYPHDQQDEI